MKSEVKSQNRYLHTTLRWRWKGEDQQTITWKKPWPCTCLDCLNNSALSVCLSFLSPVLASSLHFLFLSKVVWIRSLFTKSSHNYLVANFLQFRCSSKPTILLYQGFNHMTYQWPIITHTSLIIIIVMGSQRFLHPRKILMEKEKKTLKSWIVPRDWFFQ